MIYGLYESAGGMLVNEYRQGVVANNLANADTVGFKRDVATFTERLPAEVAGVRRGPSNDLLDALSGGTWIGDSDTIFEQGPLAPGGTTDVALEGPGFFMVEHNGQTQLTRDGRMRIDPDGVLRSATDGAAVLGAGGAPLRVNPRGGALQIDSYGFIEQDGARIGQLAVTGVAEADALRKVGASRFEFDPEALAPATGLVVQGRVEQADVAPVREMVAMLESTRVYQVNARLLSLQDQSIGRLLSVTSS